jgi:hypothetical protein
MVGVTNNKNKNGTTYMNVLTGTDTIQIQTSIDVPISELKKIKTSGN